MCPHESDLWLILWLIMWLWSQRCEDYTNTDNFLFLYHAFVCVLSASSSLMEDMQVISNMCVINMSLFYKTPEICDL